ncbi:MAG: superoxide dismutase [Ni] [Candidatus Omnitrophota bacterium]
MILNKKGVVVMLFVFGLVFSDVLFSHCQLPCGIFDDPARIKKMEEDITTIEKSMNEITRLSRDNSPEGQNQIVRWIGNKEEHAEDINQIAMFYFLAQRVLPVDKSHKDEYQNYLDQLELLHKIIVTSTKTKQMIDLGLVRQLRDLVKSFGELYMKSTKQG